MKSSCPLICKPTGAMVGFVLVARFLSIYVDLGVQTSLTQRDPRWVGAWWLGFAIFGVLCCFWSFWLLGFPKEFPGTRARREREKKAMTNKVGVILGFHRNSVQRSFWENMFLLSVALSRDKPLVMWPCGFSRAFPLRELHLSL